MLYDISRRVILFLLRRFLGKFLHASSLSSLDQLELSSNTSDNCMELSDVKFSHVALNKLLAEVGEFAWPTPRRQLALLRCKTL